MNNVNSKFYKTLYCISRSMSYNVVLNLFRVQTKAATNIMLKNLCQDIWIDVITLLLNAAIARDIFQKPLLRLVSLFTLRDDICYFRLRVCGRLCY